jgi:hypothetical protein
MAIREHDLEAFMSISSVGTNVYQNASGVTTPATTATVSNSNGSAATSQTSANATGSANNSTLALAVNQALAQLSGGANLSSLLTPASQQSSSDFISSLLASLQGSSSSNSSSTNPLADLFGTSSTQAPATPVTLDPSSSTIKLQTSIQNLISQLDGSGGISSLLGGSTGTDASPGLAELQQSFNSLVTAAGGNPTQASLQSFLKTVAVSIQGSTSIGSLFDASA